ncbi:MAG: hypothetical protein ACYCVD_04310 [Desulfitobacteriaceae bacterium]
MAIIKKFRKGSGYVVKHGEIKAVHDSDIVTLLKSLDAYDAVVDGKSICRFCGGQITVENIQAVFPADKEVAFCCSDTSCYKQLLDEGAFDVTK